MFSIYLERLISVGSSKNAEYLKDLYIEKFF